jgi:hypothetical protein
MSLEIRDSTQFKVLELAIVTKAGPIDITGIYEEISIYDSLFMPVMSGNILIRDSIGLSSKLFFDGSESLLINIVKDENSDIGNFKKAFRIYKQSERKNISLNDEAYVLSFVSDELIYSDQQKVNQSYEFTYSEIVEKIMIDYLKISDNNKGGFYDKTVGLKKLVIPNLTPIEAIQWCAKRAVDEQQSPNFLFFQNLTGYNFASLSKLLTKEDIIQIKFEPKNLKERNAIQEISSARALEVVSQTNEVEKTRTGVNAGKFIGFDPMTRTIAVKNISYGDHYDSMKHGNQNPNTSVIKNRDGLENTRAFDSRKILSTFGTSRQFSEYIKKNDPTSISKEDNIENWLFQRKAILNNLLNRRVKVVMPGNFQLTSGFNVALNVPVFGAKEKGGENDDKGLSGKYIIVASRQIIKYNKHETIIEVATTSTANEFIPASTGEQTEEILTY